MLYLERPARKSARRIAFEAGASDTALGLIVTYLKHDGHFDGQYSFINNYCSWELVFKDIRVLAGSVDDDGEFAG